MRAFHVDIAQSEMDDLRDRLAMTRWPDEIPHSCWTRGVPLDHLKELAIYWQTGFDWTAMQERINSFDQFTTTIDDTTIHFLHIRSPHPAAVPLLLLHGWPGSFVEFLGVVDHLTLPADPKDAFHLIIPSIPGFGFSGPLTRPGWNLAATARAWAELMRRLGYDRYGVQGGDFGALIALDLAGRNPEQVLGAHVNFLITRPQPDIVELSESDQLRLRDIIQFDADPPAYIRIQGTRPQTVSYGLTDSPAGLLAWITEKFHEWTDPEQVVDRDELLTNVSLYWFTRTASSAAQLYFEVAEQFLREPPAPAPTVPIGVAVLPHDFVRPVRCLAERELPTITRWTEFDRGGHFAAMEQPELFVDDVRTFFRSCR